MLSKKYLLDINVLAALTTDEHEHYSAAHRWFDPLVGDDWCVCPLTEAGYIRLAANPATKVGPGSVKSAVEVLAALANLAGYQYWPITESWDALTAPFANRIFSHQQVTDAYLLGLAIKNDGVLVTFDRGMKHMAGPEFERHLLVLE